MSDFRLSTPVAFIIFNRPDTTARVFEAIRQAKPPQLLVIADGPRAEHPEDAEKCAAARAIIEQVDWDCKVLTNFAKTNMGCKRRVSSGLDWVFETVEETIVLEDDCLPHSTFFRFCEELLDRYRDDERIMAISGDNYQFGRQRTRYSYYFSRYPHCWGWATWRRAWRHYDGEMELWPVVRDGGWLEDILGNERAIAYWTRIFDKTHNGDINSWAYAWTFACWIQSGLTILPAVNLVSNIGFGLNATHTRSSSRIANLGTHQMDFPFLHSPFVLRDARADELTQASVYEKGHLLLRLRRKAQLQFRRLYTLWRRLKLI
jgi:hypothetical protein